MRTRLRVFDDPLALFEPDIDEREVRWRVIGLAGDAVVLLVVHTAREEGEDEVIRLISARRATRKERRQYGEVSKKDSRR